ncbi:deoxyribonuclease IV [Cohnella sp.]|uniref:deoxyribonuclease IV n=1 Tax=Cohnella sp. TaxID=1883426 RepID=UPI003563D929
MSTRNGYQKAAEYAVSIGGNAFQYFPKNPRTLSPKTFDRNDSQKCASWCDDHDILSIAHGPYPVNPAAEGEAALKSALCTLNDLEIAEACGSIGVVVHFGSYKGQEPLKGYQNIIKWINSVTSIWRGKAKILLENQAGDHGPMGTTPEELMQIRALCDSPEQIGFCLDTCHLYASGEWRQGEWQAFADRAAKLGFWDNVSAIHLNDSRYPAGSCKDRHAPIAKGWIGETGFRELLATPVFKQVPLLLETPASEDGTHRDQLIAVHQLSGGNSYD